MLIVTCSTEAISFTESASTVDRDRAFTTTTEALSFTEAAAPINRTRHVNPASVEVIAFAESAAVVEIYRATIAVTLPSISVILTGEGGLLNTLVDTATVREALGGGWDATITDIVLASEVYASFFTNTVTDTANASDSITATAGPQLHDTATVVSTFAAVWTANLSTGKWKRAYEQFSFGLAEALTDVVNASNVLTPSRIHSLHESAYANQVLTASTSANNALSSTVNASDSQVIGLGETVTAAVNVVDTITQTAEPQQLLVDAGTANDVLVASVAQYATLIDELSAEEQLIFGASVLSTMLEGVATVSEVLWAADLLARAWVLNMETAGLTTYDNYEFSSMVEHNGVLYGVSPAGVFALNGSTDNGRDIAANVKTGFMDFNMRETKRMSDLYVGYTGGDLECDVESYDGPQEVYTYQLEEREANAPRNNRMKIGKGLSSRYWRIDVKNVNGADFQLYNIEANIGRSNRRL